MAMWTPCITQYSPGYCKLVCTLQPVTEVVLFHSFSYYPADVTLNRLRWMHITVHVIAQPLATFSNVAFGTRPVQ